MNELSLRAQEARAALREDGASHAEHERVRARLSALGLAMTVSASASLASGAAASAGGATSTSVASVSNGALGTTAGGGGVLSKAAAGAAVGLGAKLAALPVALKAGVAVLVVAGALATPRLTSRPAMQPTHAAQRTSPAARASSLSVAHQPDSPPARSASLAAEREPRTPVLAPAERPAQVTKAATLKPAPAQKRDPGASNGSAPNSSTLAAESALLEAALYALRDLRLERADALLTRHEDTYGAPALLARERERMRKELSLLMR